MFPPYWGGGTRTYNLVEKLSESHEVHLMYPSLKQFKSKDSNQHKEKLENLGVRLHEVYTPLGILQYVNPFFLFKSVYLSIKTDIDMIFCDYPWSGLYTLFVHFLTGKKFVFIEHNVEYLIKWQIGAKYVNVMKYVEKLLAERSSAVTVVCREDKDELSRFDSISSKIFVLENGFDEKKFYPDKKYSREIRKKLGVGESPFILFFGKLDYPPNKEAVYHIRWEIMPKILEKMPDAKFVVVGDSYRFDLEHDSLIFTDVVDNIERYINASDVVIAPLLKGGGTKIKILESIACGKKVITTSKGAEGLMNEFTRDFIEVSDDWESFSENIIDELKSEHNPKIPNGFIKKYSWNNIYEKFDKILEGISN